MTQRKLVLAALLLATAAVTGCAPLAPWQRGNLAKPSMALEPNPAKSAMRTHMHVSREAASGGDSTAGGACGCN